MPLTTYNEVKELIKNELAQLKESPYPEDIIRELADSEVPIYYGEIIKEWSELDSEDCDQWKAEQYDAERITDLMAYDLTIYYSRKFLRAWKDVQDELELETDLYGDN